jgi:hypothetical protein
MQNWEPASSSRKSLPVYKSERISEMQLSQTLIRHIHFLFSSLSFPPSLLTMNYGIGGWVLRRREVPTSHPLPHGWIGRGLSK